MESNMIANHRRSIVFRANEVIVENSLGLYMYIVMRTNMSNALKKIGEFCEE